MDVQTIIALAVVGLCGAYVAWKYLRLLIKPESAGCHCAHCPAAKESACNEPVCPSEAHERTSRHPHREVEV